MDNFTRISNNLISLGFDIHIRIRLHTYPLRVILRGKEWQKERGRDNGQLTVVSWLVSNDSVQGTSMSIYIEIGAEIMHYAQHMYFIGTLHSFVEHSRIHNFVSFEGLVLAFFLWMASAQYKKTNKENRGREWKSQYLNSGNWKSVEIRSCFNKWAADVSRTNWPITIYKLTIHCEKTMLDTRLHVVLLNNRPIA